MNNTDLLNQLNQQQSGGVDQSNLQSLLGGSNGSLIPESLTQTLTIGFIVLNVVSILFLLLYILSVVRKWKVQTAILRMQKDVAELKLHMIGAPVAEPVESAPAPVEPMQEAQPKDENTQS